MEGNILVFGKMTNAMVAEHINMQMVMSMKECGRMIKPMGLVNSLMVRVNTSA